MIETIKATFSLFYRRYFRLKANLELGPERAEISMFSLGPGSDRRLLNRSAIRNGFHVHNEGPGDVYVAFGTDDATTDNYTILLPVDTSYDVRGYGKAPRTEIRATADQAGTRIMVTETRIVTRLAPTFRTVLDTDPEPGVAD